MKTINLLLIIFTIVLSTFTYAEVLDAKVRFGGTIHYKGTPEVLKTKKIIGGTIKAVN